MPWFVVQGFEIVGQNVLQMFRRGLRAMGFGHFLTLPMLPADKALPMALMERWSPITRTFHLPMGRSGCPDRFLYDDWAIYGWDTSTELGGLRSDLVARCIGPQPVVYYKGTKVSFHRGSRMTTSGPRMRVRRREGIFDTSLLVVHVDSLDLLWEER